MSSKETLSHDVISFGTVYLDMDFLSFPFVEGIFAHRETVGDQYTLEVGGSAFNFAKVCASLELEVLFVGKIGRDPIGEVLKQIASRGKVRTRFVESSDGAIQTNVAAHYVHEDGTSIMTSAGSANQNLSPDDVQSVVKKELPQTRYLYLGGGLKLLNLLPSYPHLISEAKKHGVKVILDHGRVTNLVTEDHKRVIHSIISDVDIYLPSKDEFLDMWSFSSLEQGLQAMEKKFSGVIVVKDSTKGSHSIQNGQIIAIQPVPVTPVNTIGAGDSFNAGFIKADALGLETIEQKMQFASASAGIKISTNNPPAPVEVQRFVEQYY
jgi:sugar/nucleoside kinase (ribokinase family)